MPLPNVPESLRELNVQALVGQPVDEARHLIEAAGGEVWTVEPGAAMDASLRPRRVVLTISDGRVVHASADFADFERARPHWSDG